MGNMGQESSYDPTLVNSSGHSGLCQWGGSRLDGLMRLASESGRPWTDLAVQVDWLWTELDEQLRHGGSSKDEWLSISDLDRATYVFGRCYERGSEGEMMWENRLSYAHSAYEALRNGLATGAGQAYADAPARQRAVADSAARTPAAAPGHCQAWVYRVFANAGLPIPNYASARECYEAVCDSTDRGALQVGMVVAVPKSAASGGGASFGHVGVYVGDGTVMHCTGGRVITCTLDEWIGTYGKYAEVRWGFPPSLR